MITRNLYRLYLYAVFVVMLIFATAGLATFLQALFSLTGLHGSYSGEATNAAIIQAGVFFAVSWFIAALIGGLHYWLIRRDMRNDPETGGSNAIRSFFLNMVELIAAPVAIGTGAITIGQLWQNANLTYELAVTLSALVLVGALEWERRRATAGTTVGLFFQRFSLYGIQFILLIILISNSIPALNVLVDALFFGGATYRSFMCGDPVSAGCQGPNALAGIAAVLWVALFWVAYGFAGRKVVGSLLQHIAYFISFAVGVIFALYGIGEGITLIILNVAGEHITAVDIVQTYNFTAALVVGLPVMAVYTLWLRGATSLQSVPSVAWQTALSIQEAIVAGLMALAFYAGAAATLLNLFESPVSIRIWAGSLAPLITGIGYIAFDVHLYRRWNQDVAGAREARRGFVFVLLGTGMLSTAIGGAFALYTVISSALGSPLNDWQHLARVGASVVAVGLFILVVYFVLSNRQKLLARTSKNAAQVALPATSAPEEMEALASPTIEGVLDALLAGKLSREQAATQIREMMSVKIN